jgi:hypothetical protein
MHGGHEDDGGPRKPRMIADHRSQLKSVELGHRDVDENDRDLATQQLLERLPSRTRLDERFPELLEDHFVTQQLRRLIVHEEYVDRISIALHGRRPTDAARCEAPKAVAPC